MDRKEQETYKDYRLCHEAMGAGHDKGREYLSNKYSVPCNTVADLWRLAGRLFVGLSDATKRRDKADAEVQLNLAASMMGRKGGQAKSPAKTAAARENGKRGGRPPLCAECKERCEAGLTPVWMKYRANGGLMTPIQVPLCIDHRNVSMVTHKGRHCVR